MPNRDGTGPQGKGPMTGRGFGNCSDEPAKEVPRGRGPCGRGLKRGLGNRWRQ